MLVKPIETPAVCSRDALLQGFEGELLQQGYPPSTVHRKRDCLPIVCFRRACVTPPSLRG